MEVDEFKQLIFQDIMIRKIERKVIQHRLHYDQSRLALIYGCSQQTPSGIWNTNKI